MEVMTQKQVPSELFLNKHMWHIGTHVVMRLR